MWIIFQNLNRTLFSEIFVRFIYLLGMIADQNFYDVCFMVFYPRASAMAEDENCTYGNTAWHTHVCTKYACALKCIQNIERHIAHVRPHICMCAHTHNYNSYFEIMVPVQKYPSKNIPTCHGN